MSLPLTSAFGLFQAVQGGRVKRYSSQRQRAPVPEPAPPMHISIMEGHYYDPRECLSLPLARLHVCSDLSAPIRSFAFPL